MIKDILGLPEHVDKIGNIYPVRIKDYDEFMENCDVLLYNKDHFDGVGELKLFDILMVVLGENFKQKMINLIKICLKQDNVKFVALKNFSGFIFGDTNYIDADNFEEFKKIVLRQNLLFEPKVYKNKLVQEWAEKALRAKMKDSINITIDDKITTVVSFTGISYETIAEMTIFQLEATFNRICKFMDYITSVHVLCAGTTDIKLSHFAEFVDLYKNPYDSLFVSDEKLNKINKIF